MIVIEPSFSIIDISQFPLELIELAGRTCYKSEDRIDEGTSKTFAAKMLESEHESVIEHAVMTARFVCDRGVSHEIVRHRLCSFSQESTRYCNYGKKKFGNSITVIRPCFWTSGIEYKLWFDACQRAESSYFALLSSGASPQQARSVLPDSLKTEIVVTANFRQWRTMFKQRCSNKAHPQMRQLMIPLLQDCRRRVPIIFDNKWEGEAT